MKWKRAAAVMLAAAIAASASAGTQSWDFSVGVGDEWRLFEYPMASDPEEHLWIVKDGTLQHSGMNKWGVALVGKESWNDYVAEAKMRVDGQSDTLAGYLVFAARFLSEHRFSCYLFACNPEEDRVYLARQSANADSVKTTVEAAKEDLGLEIGKWFHIRAHVENRRFRFYINDVLTIDKRDGEYIGKGLVGFSAQFSAVSFDDLTVTGDNIKDRLAIDPEGSMAAQWAALKRN